jgi:hypothetical protein
LLFQIGRKFDNLQRNFGGMGTPVSELLEPDEIPAQERVPLSGEALDVAIMAMETPDFLSKLTGRIMQQAKKMGFHSPFEDSMNLPGGKSAADLADDILEKALAGNYNWDRKKFPDFTNFCCSRARSILSNWLNRMRPYTTLSPLPEKDPNSGKDVHNELTKAVSADDIYSTLRLREGGSLGDRFLEDFALSLADGSVEQRIIMAVFDDRNCGSRSYCRSKLGLSEADYDAGVKRLLRKLPVFAKEWCVNKGITTDEFREAR